MMEYFFGIKNFKTVIVSFFRIKNFKSGKAVVEFPLSFKNFKSCQKVTVRALFQWSRFIKVSYDDQISRNNIFSASLNFFDYKTLISMKKVVEHHFSKYCMSFFPTTRINSFTYIMSEATVRSFSSCSCSEHLC